MVDDARWMAAAVAIGERGRGRTAPNPAVGCLIVRDGQVIGRGWTQPGGRPHAEAVALEQAGDVTGATLFVTLEPCAHDSVRGPACADLLIAARPARVVVALVDPDPRTAGRGIARLRDAGIRVDVGCGAAGAAASMAGFLLRQRAGRPHVTLKLATSLDGRIAMADGRSRWITGDRARRHAHLERARCDLIVAGAGTVRIDAPRLDVRIGGLTDRSPRRGVLTRGQAPAGWERIAAPEAVAGLAGIDTVLVEGGAGAAAAFVRAGLVDRLLLYRAPILVGAGLAALGDIGLDALHEAHGRWRLVDARMLGSDRLEVYDRVTD
ncbi:bifunctional diaminohydroxyphosphoribosylaminopyrimidine deaminase/5-amino-6-(5-phosphoribosylamino)uracil reductase RibD [Sphingomonas montana]|uniref:bifunctional diaminohydroxyphosphoribosylaminopyrimidine deaminase/5-amino-6-(5-phosphoribosylamino)uracil reductase RibD n=1 Tax=Sphingomonas montana TaxID=1843236 RepID=UPI0023E3E440|nr:bifunctional diaminohydroxyphosphoribosylaminopyrimidine deaminase/5-amino-6-(5-phosphoribosylamino)uracil reductase RibD [Sphingomonas montana]